MGFINMKLSIIYENLLLEEKRYKFKDLEKNKIPLTDEEEAEVRKKDAIWNNDWLAVWKSEIDGEVVYVTHTHRAFNTAKSLNAIINKFHNFIKGTS